VRKIWIAVVAGIGAAFAGGLACQRPCYLNEADFKNAPVHLPANLDCDPKLSVIPQTGLVPPPTTVDQTQRPPRYLSLREAIAIALENGTVGVQSPNAPGTAVDTLSAFAGTTVTSSDGVRVLAIDPAVVANNIELSLSKFDAFWSTSLTWNWTETPSAVTTTGTSLNFLSPGVSIPNINSNALVFNSGIEKPLPTGGVAGITFGLSSTWSTPPGQLNPLVEPSVMFHFEQPLLQGFGVEINQLLDTHPTSLINPTPIQNTGEGILITRIRRDEQRAEFERNIDYLLLNVEAAYWTLYGAYYQLYSREESMRYAFEAWRLTEISFKYGKVNEQAMAQNWVQYEQFRSQRLTALGQVLESERQLRSLLGLPIEDGTRLVPTDAPTMVPFKPDWQSALSQALAQRPELYLARQDLKFQQLNLIRQKNALLPDLRFVGTDTLFGIGSQIDGGPVPANALHNLFGDPFNNFSIGLQMNVPIGFRAANVNVRNARLNLERSYLNLLTEEQKAQRFLGLAYRQVFEFQQQIEINRVAVEAATLQLQRYFDLIREGKLAAYGADLILAEQSWSTTTAAFYTAVVQYNTALATLDFARGAIMNRDNVYIGDGPLPGCAQIRAVEHERQRTAAIVLKERAACATPAAGPGGPCAAGAPGCNDAAMVPVAREAAGPQTQAVSSPVPLPIPTLLESQKPVPDISSRSGAMAPAARGPAPAPDILTGGPAARAAPAPAPSPAGASAVRDSGLQ
jgi:outer membrane protein TolC